MAAVLKTDERDERLVSSTLTPSAEEIFGVGPEDEPAFSSLQSQDSRLRTVPWSSGNDTCLTNRK